MKLNKSLWVLTMIFSFLVVASCQDSEKQQEDTDEIQTEEAQTYEELQEERTNSVAVTIKGNPSLSTFANRIDVAGLEDDLEEQEGAVTVFAPNNNAYSYLYREHSDEVLLDIENSEEVQYHIVEGAWTLEDLKAQLQENNGTFHLPTLEGSHLMVSMMDDDVVVRGHAGSGGKILESDIEATNGVIHIVETVIMPGEVEKNVELRE